MFKSAINILALYLDDVTPYSLYSIEMQRSQNPEDLYFLCHVKDAWYVVYETDYIVSLPHAAKEIADTFASDGVVPLHWLVKKSQVDEVHTATMSLDASVEDHAVYDALVSRPENSYLRHAVLAVKTTDSNTARRYDPSAYGYTK